MCKRVELFIVIIFMYYPYTIFADEYLDRVEELEVQYNEILNNFDKYAEQLENEKEKVLKPYFLKIEKKKNQIEDLYINSEKQIDSLYKQSDREYLRCLNSNKSIVKCAAIQQIKNRNRAEEVEEKLSDKVEYIGNQIVKIQFKIDEINEEYWNKSIKQYNILLENREKIKKQAFDLYNEYCKDTQCPNNEFMTKLIDKREEKHDDFDSLLLPSQDVNITVKKNDIVVSPPKQMIIPASTISPKIPKLTLEKERRIRPVMFIIGLSLYSVSYIVSFATISGEKGKGMIPFAGPLLAINDKNEKELRSVAIYLVAAQSIAITIAFAGLIKYIIKRTRVRRIIDEE